VREYPLRQGDLVGPVMIGGTRTPIVQIVHPTCDLGKASVDHVQVCVVKSLSILTNVSERERVVAGMREKEGRFLVAFAHTFFLPGMLDDDEGMFADFRGLHLVDRRDVSLANRQVALTHDCRVHFIRRWLYFRFRILLSLDQVRGLEAERIRADSAFLGPKPPWAS